MELPGQKDVRSETGKPPSDEITSMATEPLEEISSQSQPRASVNDDIVNVVDRVRETGILVPET